MDGGKLYAAFCHHISRDRAVDAAADEDSRPSSRADGDAARAAQGLPVDIRAEISYLHRDGQLRVMYIDAQVGEMLKQIPAQLGADLRRFQGELLVGTLSLYLKGAYKLQLLL